jgi:hypothetical protein
VEISHSRLLLVAATCSLASCAFPWLDHSTSKDFERELAGRSKTGLALARISEREPVVELRFFDGQTKDLPVNCCGKTAGRQRNASAGGTISGNRIVVVDMSAVPGPDKILNPATALQTLASLGGQVVMMNAQGVVIERSQIAIDSDILALSPDTKRFAFYGVLRGPPPWQIGIYVAGFHDKTARLLMAVTVFDRPEKHVVGSTMHPWKHTTLDWSPDGKQLLFSMDRSVNLLDAEKGRIAQDCRWRSRSVVSFRRLDIVRVDEVGSYTAENGHGSIQRNRSPSQDRQIGRMVA